MQCVSNHVYSEVQLKATYMSCTLIISINKYLWELEYPMTFLCTNHENLQLAVATIVSVWNASETNFRNYTKRESINSHQPYALQHKLTTIYRDRSSVSIFVLYIYTHFTH